MRHLRRRTRHYLALATDYDGTLAENGQVLPEVIESLRALRHSGRKLILVTGREHSEITIVFPDLEICNLVDTSITPSQLDPIYFDGRHYDWLPGNASADEPYALFVEALAKLDRYAIGMLTLAKQKYLVAVRAEHEVLRLSILHRQADFRAAEKVEAPATRSTAKKMALAETLINAATERKIDVGHYEVRYRTKLREAIDAKVQGKEVVGSEQGPEPKVINLMKGLTKNGAQARPGTGRDHGPARKTAGTASTGRGTRHAAVRRRAKAGKQAS